MPHGPCRVFLKAIRYNVFIANAGGDSVTMLERKCSAEPLKWKCDLQFPKYSTPIDVQAVRADDDDMIGIS